MYGTARRGMGATRPAGLQDDALALLPDGPVVLARPPATDLRGTGACSDRLVVSGARGKEARHSE